MTQTTQDELEKLVSMLLKAAQAEHMAMTADQRVGASDAAKLLKQNKETLAKARQEKRGPRYFNLPVGSAKKSYRLDDLAKHILSRQAE